MTLLTPERLELAHSHLAPWIGNRNAITVAEAATQTLRSMEAAGIDDDDRAGATPRVIATILKIRGFTPAEEGIGNIVFVRKGSQSEERLAGLTYARRWREQNEARFNAQFGAGKGGAE